MKTKKGKEEQRENPCRHTDHSLMFKEADKPGWGYKRYEKSLTSADS